MWRCAENKKVLLVDFDPQANLSMSFGIERPDELPLSMNNVLSLVMDGSPLTEDVEYILHGEKLDIIPSNINLSVTEINLRDEMGGERTLSDLLEPLRAVYNYIKLIVDCFQIGLGVRLSPGVCKLTHFILPVNNVLRCNFGQFAFFEIRKDFLLNDTVLSEPSIQLRSRAVIRRYPYRP